MIRIDHISFDFTAPDEAFAHRLYANWDGFCHRCFERVAEECLASYGDDRMLHELERLDLDLGNIPEEDFYSEFPRRLKEALTNALPPLHALQIQTDPEITAASRKKNLFFYLEHGHPLPEWADGGFDPQEEAAWLMNRSTASCHAFIREAAVLCLKREYALRRLLCQTNDDALFLYLYAATLAEPSAGIREKRRLLALLLEERPDIPVRFVHETGDEDKLREMSVLLDTLSVRGIIQTETKEHAEVDLPPYWHYLYEWLVRYYPYNGIAIFGGKEEFIRHLHHRLLTFIHKRDGASYLSKTELTVGFLLEVFGAAYYKNVLNAIYLLQPHNPDGSPVYDSYFNRELYRMFLRLSLLHLPEAIKEDFTAHEDNRNGIALPANAKDFTVWLTDTSQSLTIKRMLLATLVKEQPEVLVRWLQAEAIQDGTLLFLLAELADDAILYQLITSFSFAASETAKAVQAYLEKHELGTSRLKGLSEPHLAQAFRRSAFRWLANGGNNAETLLRMVYRELAGKEEDDAAVETLARRIKEMKFGEKTGKETADIRHLQTILANPMLSDTIKRRGVAHFWDNYREDYAQAVLLLQEYELLSETMRLTSRNAWTELVRRMAMQVFGKDAASGILSLIEWLTAREDKVSGYLTESSPGIRNGMLLWFAHQGQDYPGMSPGEAARSLLTFLFGKENARLVLRQIAQESASGSEDAEQVWGWLENTVANEPRALQTTYKKWKHCHEGASNTLRTLFESRRHTAEDFAGWLNDTSQTIYEKRELLREAATGNPSEWLRLLRALPEGSTALASLRGMLASQDLLGSIAQANFHQASVLSRVMERLHHPTTVLPVSLTGGIPLETFLRSALLAYLRDPEALGRTLSEREITDRFLSYLRLAATGKGHDEPDAVQWRQLAESVADTQSGNVDESLVRRITGRPDELLAWLEQEADKDGISRLAVLSDGLTAGHWADCLAAMPGFAYPDAFRQLTAWLLRRMPVRELVPILFLYVKEPGWRTFTPEQMEMYFFSRLYGKTHALPAQETLADENLPEAIRKRLFRRYLHHRSDQLLAFIRKTVLRNTMPLGR